MRPDFKAYLSLALKNIEAKLHISRSFVTIFAVNSEDLLHSL
jgi:hypothetical protein